MNQNHSEAQVQERIDWRQKFLELGGFNHLYDILMRADVAEMLAVNQNKQSQNTAAKSKKYRSKASQQLIKAAMASSKNATNNRVDQARCLGFLISILKIFLQAALLTVDQTLLTTIMQSSTSPFKKFNKK